MGRIDLKDVGHISEEEHEEIYRRCNVKYGDVLLTKDGAQAGNIAINTIHDKFSLLSSVALIRMDKEKTCAEWIYQFFASDFGNRIVLSNVAGQAITRLTLQKIKRLPIVLPGLPEQATISGILRAIDNDVAIEQRCKQQLQEAKRALMQVLLTGEVRVKI
jgi:type I restriction enzyme S subunit